MGTEVKEVPVSCYTPARLAKLAAQIVTRCLIYEDENCYHYRWDPVNIWQYEIPQKKKKGRKSERNLSQHMNVNDIPIFTPQPQWKEMKKFRDWWFGWNAIGGLNSVIRRHIMAAVERFSWSSLSQEEDVLFLLLRLCIDTKIELSTVHFEKFSEWCDDLAQVIFQLGPFPLQKLFVTHDSLGIQPVLVSIVQQSPNLQVVHMNQWALNNEFMSSLGSCCPQLTEFSIPLMKPQVFMSDEALFSCFFGGQTSEEVITCWKRGEQPKISFTKLKFVDILYWKQTEKFIQMLSVFYPNSRIRTFDAVMIEKDDDLVQPILDVKAKLTTLVMACNLYHVMNGQLEHIISNAPYLKEVRVIIDDSIHFDADGDDFKEKLEECGIRLKDLICEMKSFEALAVCPIYCLGINEVLFPTLRTKGNCITSLHISYEMTLPDINDLYQAVNLCPRLGYLAISLPLGGSNKNSHNRSIVLKPCQTLRTLVVRHVEDIEEEKIDVPDEDFLQDDRILPIRRTYIEVVSTILNAATDLKTLGMSITLQLDDYFHQLSSKSVQTLHVHMIPNPWQDEISTVNEDVANNVCLRNLLFNIVPRFPSLVNLSIDPVMEDDIDLETLEKLNRSKICITRWRPEFFYDLPSWNTRPSSNFNFNFHVM